MIFTRLITPLTIRRGTVAESCSTPSTRKRTRRSLPSGDRCTSEAPCSTAWATMPLTSLMIGASSAVSCRSTTSAAPPSSSSSTTVDWTTSSRRVRRVTRPGDVLARGDGRAHVVARHQRDVVDGQDVGRVGHGDHERVLAREGDGRPPRSAWRPRAESRLAAAMSTPKAVRSRWSSPLRSAIERASASWRDRPPLEQHLLGRGRGRARRVDRGVGALALGEAELDDDVGQEPRPAVALARPRQAGRSGVAGRRLRGRRGLRVGRLVELTVVGGVQGHRGRHGA